LKIFLNWRRILYFNNFVFYLIQHINISNLTITLLKGDPVNEIKIQNKISTVNEIKLKFKIRIENKN